MAISGTLKATVLDAEAIRRAKRLGDLVAVSQSITASLDTKDVMERIAQRTGALSGQTP